MEVVLIRGMFEPPFVEVTLIRGMNNLRPSVEGVWTFSTPSLAEDFRTKAYFVKGGMEAKRAPHFTCKTIEFDFLGPE